jgi:uncharacterized membrane protein
MSAVIEQLFSLFCHQIPERSPAFANEAFPLCWRCTGLYFGVLASYVWIAITGGFRRRLPGVASLMSISVLMIPFLIDGWANTLGLWDTPGWLRAATGLGYGVALPLLLVPLLDGRALMDTETAPSLSQPAALIAPLAVGAVLLLLLDESGSELVFEALAIAVAAAFLIFCGNLLLTLQNVGETLRAIRFS